MENLNIDKLNRTTLAAITCGVLVVLLIGIIIGKMYFMPSATCLADKAESYMDRLKYGEGINDTSDAYNDKDQALKLVGSNALSPDMPIRDLFKAYEIFQPQGRMILVSLIESALMDCS